MATLVCFHAHPDDESIATGGTMARAAADGHRLPVLGVARVEFLGYRDSGMMGEPINDHPDCFWRADVDEAASRLADLLRDEGADVLTVYDDHGGYGHPDHIQVHRVGVRAAALAGVGRVFQSTMNRDALRRLMEEAPPEVRASMASDELDDARRDVEQEEFGTPEAEITHAVDVRDHLAAKRASMEAHASQIAPDSFFLAMPPEVFAAVFGTEWYIELGVATDEGDAMAGDLFAGVAAASLRS